MKTLTQDQQTRAAGIHSKAVDLLNAAGFRLLRQFTAAGSKSPGESFEVWAGPGGKTAVVHFYGEAGGAELYGQIPGNKWADFEAGLKALSS